MRCTTADPVISPCGAFSPRSRKYFFAALTSSSMHRITVRRGWAMCSPRDAAECHAALWLELGLCRFDVLDVFRERLQRRHDLARSHRRVRGDPSLAHVPGAQREHRERDREGYHPLTLTRRPRRAKRLNTRTPRRL